MSHAGNDDVSLRRDGASGPSSPEDAKRRIRRPRLDGFGYTGRSAYHFVTVTHGRQQLLTGEWAVAVRDELQRAAAAVAFEILAYVVMPDHVHMLVQGQTDASNGVRFMQRFKQAAGYAYRRRCGEKLWQESFFDHIIRRDEDVPSIARYISENPVRAGLIEMAEDWPHLGGTLIAGRRGRIRRGRR